MLNLNRYAKYGLSLIILLLASSGLAFAQSPDTLSLGFHIGRGDAQHMQAVRAAGGDFVVVVFNWANIEPEPNYLYWETPDAALRAAEFYGIDVIARLDQPPDWALDDSDPTPWQLSAYANFARRVAERYGGRLAGIIVWNEPNLSLEWNDRPPDAAAYTDMLKATYNVVKYVAPELPVLLGGLASTEGEGDWAINDLDYLQVLYAAGAADYFDVLTAHPYGFGRPPDDPPEKFRPNFRRLELYRQIMEANDDADKPIWVTEMGWLTWTDDPRHDWQVVTPELQADYTLGAIDFAQNNYPWLERLGIWQLNSTDSEYYGYNIWRGADQATPTYQTLADRCQSLEQNCISSIQHSKLKTQNSQVTILAPDAIIRLGDRDTLHPHWVHLHRDGQNLSRTWQGEFFLTDSQPQQNYDLLLETMQIDQSTNRIFISDVELAQLRARPRPDPTSTWVTQRFSVPPELLRAGVNTLSVTVGSRNPARQYVVGRWENMQFRNIRLVVPDTPPAAILTGWQPQPTPGGWSETSRLRAGLANDIWLTGIRPGQVWRATVDGSMALQNQVGNRPDLIFNDVLPIAGGELAATHRGLFWRSDSRSDWNAVEAAPEGVAYTVAQANRLFYAGFESEGLWQAASPTGPWNRSALTATTVVDLMTSHYRLPGHQTALDRIFAVTESEIFVNNGLNNSWQSLPLPGLSEEELDEAGESLADKYKPYLFFAKDGRLVVRHQDRLWMEDSSRNAVVSSQMSDVSRQNSESETLNAELETQNPKPETQNWKLFGPEDLYGKLYSVVDCCDPGALVGTNDAGVWQLSSTGNWQRVDDGTFSLTDATELLKIGRRYFAAGDLGLFVSQTGQHWDKVDGLPATVSDVVVDPADPSRWIAGTPAGLYRSRDGGQHWESVSPPWMVWDLAFGPQDRLFVGRSNGLIWSDDLGRDPIDWHTSDGMEKVYFLQVKPHPVDPQVVWSGTWGNNIGVSDDGGQSVEPLHNGLETLSGLDLIWHSMPGQVTLATFEGLHRTDDGGQSWFKLPGSLAQQTVYALLQSDDGAIWAGAADGLWVSRDYGVTWERIQSIPQATVLHLGRLIVPRPQQPVQPPFLDRANEPLVYAVQEWLWTGTESAGLWVSQDNGATWRFAGLPERTVYNIFFDPLQPRRLVAATDGGIFSVDVSDESLLALLR